MGFYEKIDFGPKSKIPGNFFQPWNSKPFKVHESSNLKDPRDTPHTQGGSKRAMNPTPV